MLTPFLTWLSIFLKWFLRPVGSKRQGRADKSISWADEERDTSAWLGNELQQDAFKKLYGLQEKLSLADDSALWKDYGRLQESDHLYYMCTKFFSDGEVHKRFNPYDTPYEAFINYMNVLSDFIIRVNNAIAEKQ